MKQDISPPVFTPSILLIRLVPIFLYARHRGKYQLANPLNSPQRQVLLPHLKMESRVECLVKTKYWIQVTDLKFYLLFVRLCYALCVCVTVHFIMLAAQLLNLSTVDILGTMILCCGVCSVHGRMFSTPLWRLPTGS